jgi:hypothetical protein
MITRHGFKLKRLRRPLVLDVIMPFRYWLPSPTATSFSLAYYTYIMPILYFRETIRWTLDKPILPSRSALSLSVSPESLRRAGHIHLFVPCRYFTTPVSWYQSVWALPRCALDV